MNYSIDDCFLDELNSEECLGDNPEEKLLEMIWTLYILIEKKENEYLKTNKYNEDDLKKIEGYIKNLLKHVNFYVSDNKNELKEDNKEKINAANKAAEAERLAVVAAAEKAKTAAEKAKTAAKEAKTAAEANVAAAVAAAEKAVAEAEKAVADAQKVAEAAVTAVADANTAVQEAKNLLTEARNLLAEAKTAAEAVKTEVEEEEKKKNQVQLVKSVLQSSSPPRASQSSPPRASQSSSSARASQSQLESTKNTTGLQLSDNTNTNKINNNKFIINLIKILNFGLDTKITNNNTTNTNQNFNKKINNIVQQNNNIIHALYSNNNNNTTINFGNENTIVKPLFLTDGFIYDKVNIKINKYYTPLFGIDENNFFKSIPNSGENNNLNNYKLILFMIKFDYIGLNKFHNIYENNNINSIDYLDKRYNTLNNNTFVKISDNIYKINKKYYYDYTSDNIQKHIVENVVITT